VKIRGTGPKVRRAALLAASATVVVLLGAGPALAASSLAWVPAAVQPPQHVDSLSSADFTTGNTVCLSRSDCSVAGYFEMPSGRDVPAIWHWGGRSWTYEPPHVPGSAGLIGSACATKALCWAVGARFSGPGLDQSTGLVDRYDAGSWAAVAVPDPSGVVLDAVSCPTSTECLAVGNKESSPRAAGAAGYRWDGRAWSVIDLPSPHGAAWTELDSIACTSATACVAVGDAEVSPEASGYWFSERYNGRTWAVSAMPNPRTFDLGAGTGLSGLSCPTVGFCLAVGEAEGYTGGVSGLDFPSGVAYTFDGRTWRSLAVPAAPKGSNFSYVFGTDSCTTARSCEVTVGYSGYVTPEDQPLRVAGWNGRGLSISADARVHGDLAAVGCLPVAGAGVGAGWCTALGEQAHGSGAAMLGGHFVAGS
jgi:hypothetical protein